MSHIKAFATGLGLLLFFFIIWPGLNQMLTGGNVSANNSSLISLAKNSANQTDTFTQNLLSAWPFLIFVAFIVVILWRMFNERRPPDQPNNPYQR